MKYIKSTLLAIVILPLFISCQRDKLLSETSKKILKGKGEIYTVPEEPSLRGAFITEEHVIWLSGSKATVARSTDSGKSWQHFKVGDDPKADFRDIHAFGKNTALVLTAGSPARIYKTTNGGLNWKLYYENTDSLVFCNSMDFWDNQIGLVCGDPLEGYFFVLKTTDQGENWLRIHKDSLPDPLKKEAGFAASGTSIKCYKHQYAFIGTGGDKARILTTRDTGNTWLAVETPLIAGNTSQGIYSVDFNASGMGAIVGGNWEKPKWADKNFAISLDRGLNWDLVGLPSGFRSCVKFMPASGNILACGRSGVDVSTNYGNTWKKAKMKGFYTVAVSFNESLVVFAGAKGRVKIINVQ